jgi:MFS family permease
MTQEASKYNLLQMLMKKSRLPWGWAAAAVTVFILLLGILAVSLDGESAKLSDWEFWRNNIVGLLLIPYMLAIPFFVWRLRERAIQAFRQLLPQDEKDFNRLAAEVTTPKRRWEWVSVLIGISFAATVGAPWNLPWESGNLWWSVYMVIVNVGSNGLLAWLIYDTLTGAVRINRLSRLDIKVDIFDTELLTPIAFWSLGISFFFAGGICLSLIFQTQDELLRWQSIIMYVILIFATVLMFFISMWSAHRIMAEAKKSKLTVTREHLVALSRELDDRRKNGQFDEMQSLASSVNSWAAYLKLVKEVPTWPFNAAIIRRLLASTIVPIIVYLIKVLAGIGIRF